MRRTQIAVPRELAERDGPLPVRIEIAACDLDGVRRLRACMPVAGFAAKTRPKAGALRVIGRIEEARVRADRATRRTTRAAVDARRRDSVDERAIAGALASLGVPYAIATAHPTLKQLRRYRAVIWESAVDRYEGQLDKYDRAALTAYLNGGGKLLVTSNRIFDAVGTVGSPQSSDNNVKFGAEYLGERQPDANTTYVVGMERVGTVTGHGLLAGVKGKVQPSAGRKFIGVAGLAQAGTGGLGTTIKPFGAATGIATFDKASMAGVQAAKDTPYAGIAVDGDAAHHHFKTVTLGWNIGDSTNAAATVRMLQPILKHFGVPLHRYSVSTTQPVIYAATVRDQISGVATPITAVVLGGYGKPVVTLHFRRHNRGGFYAVRMHSGGVRGTYVASIPGRAVTPDGVDYYITAGGTADPVGATSGLVFHGIGVAMPVVPHPLVPKGA